jgi:hypothetical protein
MLLDHQKGERPDVPMVRSKTRCGSSSSAKHWILFLGLVLTSGAWCLPVMAQDEEPKGGGDEQKWKVLPIDPRQKNNRGQVNEILRTGTFAPGQQAFFDDFYKKFFLARWTLPENIAANPSKKVPGLPSWRKELRSSDLGKKSGAPAVHEHLNALLLDFMNQLATDGEFHPAVRVNAMLMIGDLNSVEPTATTAAVPLPDALKTLMATIGDDKLPDGVRAAAMVGIQRHAYEGVTDPDARKALSVAMLRLVGEDPPTGAGAAGRQWIMAQAAEALGLLKDPAAFPALLKMAANGKLRLCTRCMAAKSLGRLNYAGASGVDAAEAAAVLGKLLVDSCADELGRSKTNLTSTAIRQRLRQRLDVVLTTSKAIAPLAREPEKLWLAELQTDVKAAADSIGNVTDDKVKPLESLKTPVENLRKKLTAWLQKKP